MATIFLTVALTGQAARLHSEKILPADAQAMARKMIEGMHAQEVLQFKSQSKQDVLELVTDNSFLDKNLKPIAGAPVLVVFQVKTWQQHYPLSMGLGQGSAESTVKISTESGTASLLSILKLTSTVTTTLDWQKELVLNLDMNRFAAAWVLIPENGRVTIRAELLPEGPRAAFVSKKAIVVSLAGERADQDLDRAHGRLERRAKKLREREDREEDGLVTTFGEKGKVLAKSHMRRNVGPHGVRISDVHSNAVPQTDTAAAPLSANDVVAAPNAAAVQQVLQSNWIATHRNKQGQLALLRVGEGPSASVEVWDEAEAEEGSVETWFLYSRAGILNPTRITQHFDAAPGLKGERHRRTELEGFSLEERKMSLRRRVEWGRSDSTGNSSAESKGGAASAQ